MRVVKNINNNISLCLDSHNNEVVAFGKGIGFMKPPYDVPLSKIDRTFYDVSEEQIGLLNRIPEEVLETAAAIVDLANETSGHQFRENVVFTLADHIDFCIQRQKEHIHFKLPLFYEVRQLYPEESKIGQKALQIIRQRLGVELPREEGAAIALHFVNYQAQEVQGDTVDYGAIIDETTRTVEEELHVSIDKDGFNYYRFVTHMHYMMKRTQNDQMIVSQNQDIFESLCQEFPDIYRCACKIGADMEKTLHQKLTDEEMLYLMLHINRLCAREDCDQ
ncbi:PRD domain-containing protein [uncultured Subdoligranulum sp.]|uniref:PRD domain-containing protein n=1 Tax=uncultured Subdoligranulum sp. TaxID=512298 RepID=UPI00261D6EB1|nr:PRD domain-containing protein [uncultured Subdoligranulum sp.]